MARANFIAPYGEILHTYFDQSVGSVALEVMAAELNLLPGVKADVLIAHFRSTGGPSMLILAMNPSGKADRSQAIARLRELAEPKLPVTVHLIHLTFRLCQCLYFDSELAVRFAEGLGPEDQESFKLCFFARFNEYSANQLLGFITSSRIGNVLRDCMREQGAYLLNFSSEQANNQLPCTHQPG